MISAVPSVSSVHVELDDRLPSTAGRTDETTKPVLYQTRPNFLPRKVLKIDKETRKECVGCGMWGWSAAFSMSLDGLGPRS